MPRLRIWKSNLERARDRCELTADEAARIEKMLGGKTGDVTIEADELPPAFARALLDDGKIKPYERAILALRVRGMSAGQFDIDALYDTDVGDPVEFASILTAASRTQPNAELSWNGRWYPVIVLAKLHEEDRLVKHASAEVELGLGEQKLTYSRAIDPGLFLGIDGSTRSCSVLDVLEQLGFRRLQTNASAYNLRLVSSERWGAMVGEQVWVDGAVLERTRSWLSMGGLSTVPLGTEELPRRAVIEPRLTDRDEREEFHLVRRLSGYGETVSRLPLVRLFSLDLKRYVYADVDDLREYDYDEAALDKLCLPDEMRGVLRQVFTTSKTELFGDLLRGKHGGIVILASGRPGVGKTMTAEVYAEVTRRPLYVLEFGEMGTRVDELEKNLETIFARVVRWRAVLQFDECEIFLATRGQDLERSAIVGIFLRLLDYYEGLLFLTTNRPEVLDGAIRSRVMLRLEYPDLDAAARSQIWRAMFAAAGLRLTAGEFDDLATEEMNGRQIRNLVRLTRIMHPSRDVTAAEVRHLMKYGCR